MSKKEQPSKYLSAFYGPNAAKPTNAPSTSGISSQVASQDKDKFKNPADFFKSSQSLSSQYQFKAKTASNVSRGFQSKTATSSQSHRSGIGVGGLQSQVVKRPMMGGGKPNAGFDVQINKGFHRKPFSGFDQSVASTKALELQWTTKMRQAKKSGIDSHKSLGHKNDPIQSPIGKSVWADVSLNRTNVVCTNQQNDPWYSNDVWGDDLPVEAVDECLRAASTQDTKKTAEMFSSNDPLLAWMDEPWASPEKCPPTAKSQRAKPVGLSVKTCLNFDKKDSVKEKADDFVSLLSADDDFMTFLENVESQVKVPTSGEANSQKVRSKFPPVAVQKCQQNVPFSERMPVTQPNGNKSSFVIKAKEFESPNKREVLSQSQRILKKPTKSLPSPTTSKKGFTTEWLRGQLEKINSEYSTLKEDVQVKEGESKLLREKLKSAEEEVQKHKLEKAKELENLKEAFERKVKQLEKELEATQVQALFKAREAESSLEKYRELKTLSVCAPESPALSNFKSFLGGARPGESSARVGESSARVGAGLAPGESFARLGTSSARPGESSARVVASTARPADTSSKPGDTSTSAKPAESSSRSLFVDETVSTNLLDDSMDFKMIEETPQIDMTPDKMFEDVETIEALCGQVEKTAEKCLNKKNLFNRSYAQKNAVFVGATRELVLGAQPKRELNHFLMPQMEYLSHSLLQTEFTEQNFENYLVRRPTLVELWGTTYDAFGDAALDDYEKTQVGDAIPPDPARKILSKSRFFTTMKSSHAQILSLTNVENWGPAERKTAKDLINLATNMVRELYATLGDPRLLRTTYTLYDRDPEILKEFHNCSELTDDFNILSSDKWKREAFVELRRCLVLIGFLCSADHMVVRYIVNPKSCHSDRTSQFYPPTEDPGKCIPDEEVALKVNLNEGERSASELKIMQRYRDLHSKNLTIVSELISNLGNAKVAVKVEPKLEGLGSGRVLDALQKALCATEDTAACRTGALRDSQASKSSNSYEKFVEQGNFVLQKGSCVKEIVDFIDNFPSTVAPVESTPPDLNCQDLDSGFPKKLLRLPKSFLDAATSEVLRVDVDNNCSILLAPADRCISQVEKQIMKLALDNVKTLKNHMRNSVEADVPKDLDFTQFVDSNVEVEMDVSRKRKHSFEEPEISKTSKVAEYSTPPFDMMLYSQIQKKDSEEEVVVLDTQTQVLPCNDDDQIAKFEKREEIAELKKKMLLEEQETEQNHVSTSKHALGPVKIPGRASPTPEDEADDEMVMEIEKMFQTQVKANVLEETIWSSESDDESNDRLAAHDDDKVEIEFIPDLVNHFHSKLENAELLELLCEVFKEGSVLRFTHRLNGVMLGTIFLLQRLICQPKEVEPYCSKIATILREILYTRPSPRVVLEANILLNRAVSVPGFVKMLCHNASKDTFFISSDRVYFSRGACLLEMMCILVTYSTDDNTHHKLYLEMSHWVYHIFCFCQTHVKSLYDQFINDKRRCMCVAALNNTMVMIYHRTLNSYRSLLETNSTDAVSLNALKSASICGLQVLRCIYSFDSWMFISSIKTQYLEYRQYLTWLKDMHDNTNIYADFHLVNADLFILNQLLNDDSNPNDPQPKPTKTPQPNYQTIHINDSYWPNDLNDPTSMLNSESSESDDE